MVSDFFKNLFSGTLYTAIAKYLGLFVSIVVSAILARILTPEDFAVVAIATVIIGFISLITANGLSPAIIQNKELDAENINDLFSFTIYFACAASLLFYLISPFIAQLYSDKRLDLVCQILSLNVFFSIISIVPNALLFKEKKFKILAIRTIAIHLTTGLLSVCAALSGVGIYSLLISPVLSSILIFIVCIRYYPMSFHWKPDSTALKKIISFSIYQMLFNILNYSYRNIDKLLVGKYMDLASLGYYEKSYRLMMLPLDNVSGIINPVLHPLLSEYQNNIQFIIDKYIKLVKFSAYIGFFLSVLLFFTAGEIIRILYGPQWEPSISVFKIFSLSIGIQIIQSAVGAIFQAVNQVKTMFWAGVIVFCITIIFIFYGISLNSVDSLAICIVIAFFIAFFIYHIILFKKVFHISFFILLKGIWKPLFANIVVGLVLFVFNIMIDVDNVFYSFIIKLALSVFTFILLSFTRIIDIPFLSFFQKSQK